MPPLWTDLPEQVRAEAPADSTCVMSYHASGRRCGPGLMEASRWR